MRVFTHSRPVGRTLREVNLHHRVPLHHRVILPLLHQRFYPFALVRDHREVAPTRQARAPILRMEPRYSRILVRPRPCGFGAREPTSTEIRDVALPTAVVSDAQRVADVEIFHERVRDGGGCQHPRQHAREHPRFSRRGFAPRVRTSSSSVKAHHFFPMRNPKGSSTTRVRLTCARSPPNRSNPEIFCWSSRTSTVSKDA